MLYMNWEKSEYKPIVINDSTKSEYIKRTAALLENMPLYSYLDGSDSYGRHVSIRRYSYGYEIYLPLQQEQISKRTCARETARRLYELDVKNRIGY